jgi:hypothetical protein
LRLVFINHLFHILIHILDIHQIVLSCHRNHRRNLKKTKEDEEEKKEEKDDEQKQEGVATKKDGEQKQNQPLIQVHESGDEDDPLSRRSMSKLNNKNIISINSIRTSDNSRVIIKNIEVLKKDEEDSEFDEQLDELEGNMNFLHDDTS